MKKKTIHYIYLVMLQALLQSIGPTSTCADDALGQSWYRQGRHYEQAEQYDSARLALNQVFTSSSVGHDYALWHLAQIDNATGAYDSAWLKLSYLTTRYPDFIATSSAQLLAADILLLRGQKAQAQKRWAELVILHPNMRARIYLQWAKSMGYQGAQSEQFLSYLLEHKDRSIYTRKLFHALEKKRRNYADFSPKELFFRAKNASDRDLYEISNNYLAALAKSGHVDDENILMAAFNLTLLRKYADVTQLLEPKAKLWNQPDKNGLQARYLLGNSYLQHDKYDLADQLLGTLISQFPHSQNSPRAAEQLVRMFQRAENEPRFVATSQFFLKNYPEHRKATQVLWAQIFAALKAAEHQQVIELSEQFVEQYADSILLARVYYWLSQSQLQLGDRPAAVTTLVKLRQQCMDSFYAQKAGELLEGSRLKPTLQTYREQMSHKTATTWRWALMDEAFVAGPALQAAYTREWKAFTGKIRLPEVARLVADQLGAKLAEFRFLQGAGAMDEAAALLPRRLGAGFGSGYLCYKWQLFEQAGEYQRSYACAVLLAKNLKKDTSSASILGIWLKYRPYYYDFARTTDSNQDIDPLLVLAIIKQESGFDKMARSYSNDYGLMQINPKLAVTLSKLLQEPYDSPYVLFEPQRNLRYGKYFLADILNEFEFDLVKTLAAYNAGRQRVKEWEEQSTGLSPERFILEIPFPTTMHYVEKVLSNYSAYNLARKLAGKG